jgi:hypothetical protein
MEDEETWTVVSVLVAVIGSPGVRDERLVSPAQDKLDAPKFFADRAGGIDAID